MIGVIVITHGLFGRELLQTAQNIVGRQDRVAALAVLPETGAESLSAALDQALKDLDAPEGCLIVVDMLGGTPCNVALLKTKERRAEIVTGVNLYMLISAFTHRSDMDLKALATRVSEDGRRAIVLPKDLLLKRLG